MGQSWRLKKSEAPANVHEFVLAVLALESRSARACPLSGFQSDMSVLDAVDGAHRRR